MTRKFRLFLLTVIFLFSFSPLSLWAAQNEKNWVVAAQKFSFTRNQSGSVADGIATMFPARILEKLSSSMYRTVKTDESAERELYKIRVERNSLFLQLSAKVKTRDSLVLGNYSQHELGIKVEQENEKIKEIKEKLAQNLVRQRELNSVILEARNEQLTDSEHSKNNKTEGGTRTFFKSLFFNDDTQVQEKITLYKNDNQALFTPVQDTNFEKQVVDSNINCLITGEITAFDEYMSITVKARVYPGEREIIVMTEIGSVDDADLMASVFASQLAPAIANSMPCVIHIATETQDAEKSLCVYVDDVLYNDISSDITVDSGVHFIQFTAEGFKNAGTSYYFEGNKRYSIQVTLEPVTTSTIFLKPKALLEGQFVVNGVPASKLADNTSRITINGNAVLAQFITQDKTSFFLYIPEKKVMDGVLYTANVKPVNHNDFIEKRRRQMYLSYSILVTSLMPTIITKGIVGGYKPLLANTKDQTGIKNLDENINTANAYVLASNICTGISIACGVWFVYELYRYFSAANSVLPANTKLTFDYVPAEEPAAEEEALPANEEPAKDEESAPAEEEAAAADEGDNI